MSAPALRIDKDNMLVFLRASRGITSPLFSDRFFNITKDHITGFVFFKELVIAMNFMKVDNPLEFLKYIFGILSIPNSDMASGTLLDRFFRSIIHGPLIETARK